VHHEDGSKDQQEAGAEKQGEQESIVASKSPESPKPNKTRNVLRDFAYLCLVYRRRSWRGRSPAQDSRWSGRPGTRSHWTSVFAWSWRTGL